MSIPKLIKRKIEEEKKYENWFRKIKQNKKYEKNEKNDHSKAHFLQNVLKSLFLEEDGSNFTDVQSEEMVGKKTETSSHGRGNWFAELKALKESR